MLGLLRTPLRMQRPVVHSCMGVRHISTLPHNTPLLRLAQHMKRHTTQHPPRAIDRAISIASLFSPRQPVPAPPPQVVANIASIEVDADANPHNVEKQLALFRALVDANVKAGYDVLISRWERMCEFVSCRPNALSF